MKFSKPGKSFPSQTMKQNMMMIKECALVMVVTLLLICIFSVMVWVNSPLTTSFSLTQKAHGMVMNNGLSVPKAFLVYGNQRYEMTPFVHFNGKNMNKLIYPSADVTPVLTVQERDKIGTEFSENPVSVKVYIADYEADIPSLHALKQLSDNNFELSGEQGRWNIEVHAVFPYQDRLGNSNPSYRYVSYELGIDMMPLAFTKNANEIGQNACSNKEVEIAKVSGPGGHPEHPANFSYQQDSNNNSTSVNNNILSVESAKGNSSYIIDLGQEVPICSLSLKFSNGDRVVNHFNIQTSLDGIHFSKPIYYDNTAAISGEESYDISSNFPVTARFVKINFDGNTQGDVFAPMQVRVLGNN
jgi:hypothetical protein